MIEGHDVTMLLMGLKHKVMEEGVMNGCISRGQVDGGGIRYRRSIMENPRILISVECW